MVAIRPTTGPVVARAQTQNYPSRPVAIIVPFPAGGPTDTLARILADHLKNTLGQSVIVENVSGAGGSIGVGRVARAAPDGYTVSIGHWSTHVVNGATQNLSYHVMNNFEPVSPSMSSLRTRCLLTTRRSRCSIPAFTSGNSVKLLPVVGVRPHDEFPALRHQPERYAETCTPSSLGPRIT
jgi:tripartite-type tricarboxylate transporter receptor subunit TctC